MEVNVSDHIVPFRETIVPAPKVDMVNETRETQNLDYRTRQQGQALKPHSQDTETNEGQGHDSVERSDTVEVLGKGLVQIQTHNRKCTVQIRAVPLPEHVTKLLEEHADLIRTLDQYSRVADKSDRIALNPETLQSLLEYKSKLDDAFLSAGKKWRNAVNQIWAFGPKRYGPNLLLNRAIEYERPSVWSCLERCEMSKSDLWKYDNSVVSGFQLATLAGPLCEEPMMGVCFSIESFKLQDQSASANNQEHNSTADNANEENIPENDASDNESAPKDACGSPKASRRKDPTSFGAFSGQIMVCVKEGCRRAFQSQPQRLMLAMYTCVLQATSDVLGKSFAV